MSDKDDDILSSAYPYIDVLLPEFDFRLQKGHWVSGNGLKVDGETGDSVGKVFVYKNNPFCLKDYRVGSKEIPSYMANSDLWPSVSSRSVAIEVINAVIHDSPAPTTKLSATVPDFNLSFKEINELQATYVANLDPAIKAFFLENADFRGLSEKEFRWFGFGSFKLIENPKPESIFSLPLSFPLITPDKKIMSWLTYIHDKKNRYYFPSGNKPLIWFQRPSLRPKSAIYDFPNDEVVLTEGAFDCITAWRFKLPFVAALGGCSISDYQLGMLKNAGIKRVTLVLDTDAAGVSGSEKIAKLLENKGIQSCILRLPDSADAEKSDLDFVLNNVGVQPFLDLLETRRFIANNKSIVSVGIAKCTFRGIDPDTYFNLRDYDTRVLDTGLHFANKSIGYKVGTITTVVGKTSHGKTTFLLNQCLNALINGYKVLFASFEEGLEDLSDKLFVLFMGYVFCNKPSGKFDLSGYRDVINKIISSPDGNANSDDFKFSQSTFDVGGYITYILANKKHKHYTNIRGLYKNFIKTFITSGLFCLYFDYDRTSKKFMNNIDAYYDTEPSYDIVIIDYIQLLEYDEMTTTVIGLKRICLQLRSAAKTHKFAVLMGAQFGRKVSSYSDIALNGIADCSEIEKTSHLVLSLWNADLEKKTAVNPDEPRSPADMPINASVELRVLKNRGGNHGKCYYSHNATCNLLEPVSSSLAQYSSDF